MSDKIDKAEEIGAYNTNLITEPNFNKRMCAFVREFQIKFKKRNTSLIYKHNEIVT